MLLIYESEAEFASLSDADRKASIQRHIAFANELRAESRFLGGDALQPSSAATCIATRDGKPVVIDGPYAETKEQLGGFYLIEARDLDQALEDAHRIAGREGEIIEVRPILDLS
ncbi:MAG TPA: YciI family protein [Acidimicrobiia bacterium]|jgi:hypothetical protein